MIWKVSAKWAARRLDCTLAGIRDRCHGGCCYNRGGLYWPACAHSPPGGPCYWLSESGCRLEPVDRPITCSMYPLVLNDAGTWVMHFRGRIGCCAPNVERGPMLIDALANGLEAVFGEDLGRHIRDEVHAGRNPAFEVPRAVERQWNEEQALKRANRVPTRRREWSSS